MRVLMILPALTEATSPLFRPIKYSLFPPLGLATLAGYLPDGDDVRIVDEHVERFDPEDGALPDLVVIQVYVTSARRSYELADWYRARGVFVALGGLHVTSLPEEAARHADAVFTGPGEDTWPVFLADFRRREPLKRYTSKLRTLRGLPPIRRDLIRRHRYLVPNSIVVSRGCPHHCDFCYKDAFFEGGKSFYTQAVDDALAEIERLPGRHLYFLDDHLLGNRRFATALFDGMRGMGRVFQAASTVDAVLAPELLEKAFEAGLRSLFVGFESVNAAGLTEQRKRQNVGRDYAAVVRRIHDAGAMVNASFVFGLDSDGPDVFDRTVGWAVEQGIETATFHIMTPYPGTGLFRRIEAEGRIAHRDWELYDTRHVVYEPRGMSPRQLEDGYWRAYRDFYRWGNLWRGAAAKERLGDRLRHLAYAGAWKKFERVWDALIRTRQVLHALPLLETALSSFGARRPATPRGRRPPSRPPAELSGRRAGGGWGGVGAVPRGYEAERG
ncbi:B12-binding domain-containing radical SAM protein [Phytohabitans sp. LJ34]|uniref:B12-binding domain-containing radical SAM protein n=1 Tax=Phytohabitans sp. LJ34 TaxID=3452217 RepID=UPI003F8A332F